MEAQPGIPCPSCGHGNRADRRYFQVLAEGVHRFEGTVNQYTGDGIMALFGAPIAHEDHGLFTEIGATARAEQVGRDLRDPAA